ncbi:hypothetical protein EV426DRAFT_570047 [Tirmania nivea]|nr:hypothetical protein EV426DRAFT_570047 [Tirmania nivea]
MPPLGPRPLCTLLIHHIPPPPPSASQQQIIKYYRPPTHSTLKSLTAPNLTIALFAPYLAPGPPRSTSCDRAQRILTAIYSIVATSLREFGKIEGSKQDGGDVDVRVVFYWDEGEDEDGEEDGRSGEWGLGPVFRIRPILGSGVGRRWMNVVYVVGAEGWSRPSWVGKAGVSMEGVMVVEFTPQEEAEGEKGGKEEEGGKLVLEEARRHGVVIVAGTFDHLHAGHKLLLTTTAFLLDPPCQPCSPDSPLPLSPRLIVGLTGPKLLENKKHAELLHPWPQRARDTLTFLTSILTFSPSAAITSSTETISSATSNPTPGGESCTISKEKDREGEGLRCFSTITLPGERGEMVVEIVEINDVFGPTVTEEGISALVVSEETRGGGEAVNRERRRKRWTELELFVVGVVGEEGGGGVKMSSTEIRRRRGETTGMREEKGKI